MVQSIELLLDDGAEDAVIASWRGLQEAGLPSLASHDSPTNRPHVTLAVADEGLADATDDLERVFRGWALDEAGLPATLGAVVLFGGSRSRWVLARQVVATKALLALHDAVHAAIERAAPDVDVLEQTRPGSWTPHVTVTRRMPAERLPEALGLLDPAPVPFRFVGARLWDSVPATVTALGRAPAAVA